MPHLRSKNLLRALACAAIASPILFVAGRAEAQTNPIPASHLGGKSISVSVQRNRSPVVSGRRSYPGTLPIDQVNQLASEDEISIQAPLADSGQWSLTVFFVEPSGRPRWSGRWVDLWRKEAGAEAPNRDLGHRFKVLNDGEMPVLVLVSQASKGHKEAIQRRVADTAATLLAPARQYEELLNQERRIESIIKGLAHANNLNEGERESFIRQLFASYGVTPQEQDLKTDPQKFQAMITTIAAAKSSNWLPSSRNFVDAFGPSLPPVVSTYAGIVEQLITIFRPASTTTKFTFQALPVLNEGSSQRIFVPMPEKIDRNVPVYVNWLKSTQDTFTPSLGVAANQVMVGLDGGLIPTDNGTRLTLQSSYSHSWSLELSTLDGQTLAYPVAPDPALTGFRLRSDALRAFARDVAGQSYSGKVVGYYGFQRIESNPFQLDCPMPRVWKFSDDASAWNLTTAEESMTTTVKPTEINGLIPKVSRARLVAPNMVAVDAVRIESLGNGEYRITFPPRKGASAGDGFIELFQDGLNRPDVLTARIYNPAPRAFEVVYYAGDTQLLLTGEAAKGVSSVTIGNTRFALPTPAPEGVRFTSVDGVPGNASKATVALADGRTVGLDIRALPARPNLNLNVTIERDPAGSEGFRLPDHVLTERDRLRIELLPLQGGKFNESSSVQVRRTGTEAVASSFNAPLGLRVNSDWTSGFISATTKVLLPNQPSGQMELRVSQGGTASNWIPIRTAAGQPVVLVSLPKIKRTRQLEGRWRLYGDLHSVNSIFDPTSGEVLNPVGRGREEGDEEFREFEGTVPESVDIRLFDLNEKLRLILPKS